MGWKGKTKLDSSAERGAGRKASSTVGGRGRWDYDADYQKLLDEARALQDEARAQLAEAREEYTSAAIEYDRCKQTYSDAVRARSLLEDYGGGGNGMELDERRDGATGVEQDGSSWARAIGRERPGHRQRCGEQAAGIYPSRARRPVSRLQSRARSRSKRCAEEPSKGRRGH